jgi:hypothetical protein
MSRNASSDAPLQNAADGAPPTQQSTTDAQRAGFDFKRFLKGPQFLSWIGFGLLFVWVCWFTVSLRQQPLPRALPHQPQYLQDRFTYILLEPFIGLDFHHNYMAARTWRSRSDPYAELRGDPANARYTYPPLTLLAFSWTDMFPPGPIMKMTATNGVDSFFATSKAAILIWLVVIIVITCIAAWKSWATRERLGLPPLPLPFVLGATFASYPVIFELERGNCNTLPLLAIVVLVTALDWTNRRRADVAIGVCVALATGIKPYAIVLLLGLIALRRLRAAAFGVGALAIEALVFWPDLRRWLEVAHVQNQSVAPVYMDFSHSLISHWQIVWRDLGLPKMAEVLHAEPVVGSVLLIVTLAVSWRVFRSPLRTAMAWPFLLWLAAMATMVSPIAQDYNLLFIPLALLSAWSISDSWRVQLCIGAVVLWCQPFFIGLANLPWLLLKVISVMFVGVVIVRRLRPEPIDVPVLAPSATASS